MLHQKPNEIEGTFRAHQIPMSMERLEYPQMLKDWLLNCKPEELFDENEGLLLRDLR